MAVKYVKSTTGSDGNGGTSWADAYATVAKALSVISAGDTVYVSQAHAETQASAMTWTSPGTAGNPCRIVCVNDGATPPTAVATTATVATTGSFVIAFGTGSAYVYGITFSSTTGASGFGFTMTATSAASDWVFDTCGFVLNSTASTARWIMGVSGSVKEQRLLWINTTVKFGHIGQGISTAGARFEWRNTASAIAGTNVPTNLFILGANNGGIVELSGLDLSALGSGKSLISPSTSVVRFYLRNCKLGSGVAALSAAITAPGGVDVYLDNCDSGNTNYQMAQYKYQGSILQETTHVRAAGGTSNGTTVISHNLTTLASSPTLFSPLEGRWLEQWNETVGSAVTVTVELCTENVVLTNADCYLEVEYLGTSGFPESVFVNSRVANVFAAPASLNTSSVTWSGFTTAAPQNISLTFTPQVKGTIRARVCVVKASATVYVDPQIAVSGGPTISRSYGIAGSSSINETSAGSGGGMIQSRVFAGF